MNRTIIKGALLFVMMLPAPLLGAGRPPATVAVEIDKSIDKVLAENKVPVSPQADDAEYLRRVTLDITGRIPSHNRTVAFLNDANPDKRAKLVDELLADREYGEHFAIIWYHRMVRLDDDNRLLVRENNLQEWLADSFNKNRTWDKIVSDILEAKGEKEKHPETTFIFAHVDDNKGRHDPSPSKITASASKLFLGIRLECCECHNHPFNAMKQTDFWGVAAFFGDTHSEHASQKEIKDGGNPAIHDGGTIRAKKKDTTPPHAFGQIVIPDSKGKTVKAKYLGGAEPSLASHPTLRKIFANWLTSPQNKYFATAGVNKLWANFFGHGICNPVDDIDLEKATHPELLKLLADEFAASGFDQKHLIRCICASQTYQRTTAVVSGNKEDDKLYSHMRAKVMSADMLYDSLIEVLGHGVAPAKKDDNVAKTKKGGPGGPRENFRKFFHAEADDDVGVVEDYTHGVPQVLRLMNSPQIMDSSKTVTALMRAGTPEKIIEEMYLTVLSRKPTDTDVKKMKDYAAGDKFSTKAYSDLLWVLLNSGEFLFNH